MTYVMKMPPDCFSAATSSRLRPVISAISASLMPEGWDFIGTIQKVAFLDRPMVRENFTSNDSTFMAEGDEIYGSEEVSNKIYLKYSSNEYIPFVECEEY